MKTMSEDGVHVIYSPPYEPHEVLRFPGMPDQVWELLNEGDSPIVNHAGFAEGGDRASFRVGTQMRRTELDAEHAHLRRYLYRQEPGGQFNYIDSPEDGWIDPSG